MPYDWPETYKLPLLITVLDEKGTKLPIRKIYGDDEATRGEGGIVIEVKGTYHPVTQILEEKPCSQQ